jgi:4-hydroxy-2-oxoheptanedioate aldolase
MPTAREVDILAGCGLDFVRIDPYRFPWDYATLADIVRAAASADMTAWARVRNDPWEIARTLDLGVQVITIPSVSSAGEAEQAVASVFHPPLGQREPSMPATVHDRDGYMEWATSEILLGCQIETAEGIDNYREIIATEGVSIIHTGRTDIAAALGVPGEQFHPSVLDVERRIVEAAMDAGKQPTLMYPLSEAGYDHIEYWKERGVRIFALDTDYRVLHQAFLAAATRVRSHPATS